jgi:hypothetical protein
VNNTENKFIIENYPVTLPQILYFSMSLWRKVSVFRVVALLSVFQVVNYRKTCFSIVGYQYLNNVRINRLFSHLKPITVILKPVTGHDDDQFNSSQSLTTIFLSNSS